MKTVAFCTLGCKVNQYETEVMEELFKKQGYENIEYLYTSRRSLLLASITEMNDEDIETLPPYTTGQTVGEILGYLCVDREKIIHLADAGFDSFE